MSTLAAFLMGIAGSLASRVLVSLGFGIFSYAALSTLADTVSSSVISNFDSAPVVVLSLLNLAGFGQALGIILSALVTRATLQSFKRFRPV